MTPVMSASRLTTPSGSSRIIAGHMTYRTLKGHAMTGQNETPEDIADDTEGHSAKAFSLGEDLEGYNAKVFKGDDADGDTADDDAEGHSLKIGLAGSMATPGLGTDAARL